MPVNVSEFTDLLNHRSYARFINTNLHMHTPATPWDWNAYSNQTRSAQEISPFNYFEALNQTTLELVAITDHNSVEWCEPLVELANNARNRRESKLHILPGVEITTYEGPHIIALFDENHSVQEIRNFLTRLKLSGRGEQTDRVDKEITLTQIINQVVEMGGIVVGPHVHTKDGLWGPKEFRGRTDILNDSKLRILAAPSGSIKRVTDRGSFPRLLYKTMDSEVIQNSFAFINVSDCHRLDDFALNTTWLKMCRPSLEGIRQIIYEPELRVSHEIINTGKSVDYPYALHFVNPQAPEHPYIIGVAVTGGMLNGQSIALSPHQNCIIGKNYSGKSAVLDCVRFALSLPPSNESAERKFVERLRAILTEGGEVRLYARDTNGKIYAIARTLSVTNVGTKNNPKWKLEGHPNIFYLLNDSFHKDSSLHISDIFHAEAYPQGEVVKIKENVSQQMTIVDSLAKLHNRIECLSAEEVNGKLTIYRELIENSQEINRLTQQLEQIEKQLETVPELEGEIERLEDLAGSILFHELQQWTEIETKIEQYQNNLHIVENDVSKINIGTPAFVNEATSSLTANGTKSADFSTLASEDIMLELDNRYSDILRNLKSLLTECEGMISTEISELEGIKIIIERRLSTAQEKIFGQSGDTNIEELTRRITDKKRRLSDLQASKDKYVEVVERLAKNKLQREDLKSRYYADWDEIRRARREMVVLINDNSADNIQAELIENADFTAYQALLRKIAEGLSSSTNRISNYAHIDMIAETTTPDLLVSIINSNDANKLIEAAKGISENNARIMLGMGLSEIHKVELCLLDDKFEIRLKKVGDQHFTPIDGGLSGGEQALALISVAMIPKDRPLIIDQPEDELGPALITGELVEQIRRVKPKRQMLFVTHIPNIPVLADSEQIIYLEQIIENNEKRTSINCCGSLDNLEVVARLLELDGGEIAFDKRQKRYARVIHS